MTRSPLTAAAVKEKARAMGFDGCGIAPAAAVPDLHALDRWLAAGYDGEMHYMRRTAGPRRDVREVLPSARSVIATATVYNVDRPYTTEIRDPDRARIARYAWGDDYHAVIGRRLDALLQWMRETSGEAFDAKAYVDTGPVQERVYAQLAGLGWIGKNTCLINEELGSWVFLAVIVCSLPLEPDPPGLDRCGTCTLCLEACPTQAFVEPGLLDARRCISYLTIELKGAIPEPLRPAMDAHVYGCDICQEVCPWNAAPARSDDAAWQPRAAFDGVQVRDLWRRSDEELRSALRGSAMKRAGVTRLRRNVAVALGNSEGVREEELDVPGDDSPSRSDPLVREHAPWARRTRDG